jgi:hypothetical protein
MDGRVSALPSATPRHAGLAMTNRAGSNGAGWLGPDFAFGYAAAIWPGYDEDWDDHLDDPMGAIPIARAGHKKIGGRTFPACGLQLLSPDSTAFRRRGHLADRWRNNTPECDGAPITSPATDVKGKRWQRGRSEPVACSNLGGMGRSRPEIRRLDLHDRPAADMQRVLTSKPLRPGRADDNRVERVILTLFRRYRIDVALMRRSVRERRAVVASKLAGPGSISGQAVLSIR